MLAHKLAVFATLLAAIVAVGGCSYPERGTPVPQADTTRALPLGIPNARFFADGDPKPMIEEGMRALEREEATRPGQGGVKLPPVNYLAVSGGGDNGAFGAGLMNGWTETGTRPEFKMVTGVSTGALIAPFAFLGSDYDATLREVYTTMTPEKVYRARGLSAALYNDAMADTTPLSQVIAGYADQKMFDAIAREYQKGRLLVIGTTDLDAQRPVIWNIGALAASGHPGALDLFRKILRASAAIPGAFQPVLIDVEIDGRKYQEMHVDGGAFAQAFLYPAALTRQRRVRMAGGQFVVPAIAYVIRNGRLDPEWASTERSTMGIAARAIATMITASGSNDVVRIYNTTQRDGIGYNLAYIGSDFTQKLPEPFDQGYMRALFDYGYQRASRGYDWAQRPPF